MVELYMGDKAIFVLFFESPGICLLNFQVIGHELIKF